MAFPDDARHRERYGAVFSLEVLLALHGAESSLLTAFRGERGSTAATAATAATDATADASPGTAAAVAAALIGPAKSAKDLEIMPIMRALRRINLVPQVIGESQVMKLVRDVMPQRSTREHPRSQSSRCGGAENSRHFMLFPQVTLLE